MEYKLQSDDLKTTAVLSGEVTLSCCDDAYKLLCDMFARPTPQYCFDFRDVGFVDAFAIGLLRTVQAEAAGKGASVEILYPQSFVRQALQTAGLNHSFKITLSEAS